MSCPAPTGPAAGRALPGDDRHRPGDGAGCGRVRARRSRSERVRLLRGRAGGLSEGRHTVRLVTQSRTQARFGQQPGQPAPNAGQRYPGAPLTPGEVTALIGACSPRAPAGIRNRALLTLLYRSGLRISEALALRPSDIDLARHRIRLLGTKSGQPQTRGFHPSADDTLARWLDARKALGLSGRARLFCTLAGGPVSDNYVRGLLRRLAARAGITKRVHPHGLRHTFAELGRRDPGHRDLQAPRPLKRGRHRPIPRPPHQPPGRHRPGRRRPAGPQPFLASRSGGEHAEHTPGAHLSGISHREITHRRTFCDSSPGQGRRICSACVREA